jgi:hypothetical protein
MIADRLQTVNSRHIEGLSRYRFRPAKRSVQTLSKVYLKGFDSPTAILILHLESAQFTQTPGDSHSSAIRRTLRY